MVLDVLLQVPHLFHVSAGATYVWYFYICWTSYIICAIAIFFVIQEMFRHVMEPLPGLRRLGLLAAVAAPAPLRIEAGVRLALRGGRYETGHRESFPLQAFTKNSG